MKLTGSIRSIFSRSDFLKNIVVLLTGSSVALLIPILIMPVLTRMFTPEDFGIWGTFFAIVGIFSVIANGRYELALLLPSTDRKAFNLFVGSILIAVVLSIILTIPVAVAGNEISDALDAPDLMPWLWFLPLAVFTNGIIQACNYWHNRHKKFNILSMGRVVQSSSTAALNLGFGAAAYFSGAMIVASIVGQILLGAYYLFRMNLRRLIRLVSMPQIKRELHEYRQYPVKSGLGIFLNILKEQAPIFLLGFYFDLIIVGFYSLIVRMFNTPLSLVAGSVGQVYYQKAVEMKNNGRSVFSLYRKTTLRLLLGLVLPVIVVMIWGDDVFGPLFGQEWTDAGDILVIFTLYYAVRFVVSSQSSLLLVFSKLNIEVLFNSVALVLQVGSLVIGGLRNDYYLSLYLMSISGTVIYGLLGLYFWIFLKKQS